MIIVVSTNQVEENKNIINDEIKVLREKNCTTNEKKEKGWNLCKEMEMSKFRKLGLGAGRSKRKKTDDSPQGGGRESKTKQDDEPNKS